MREEGYGPLPENTDAITRLPGDAGWVCRELEASGWIPEAREKGEESIVIQTSQGAEVCLPRRLVNAKGRRLVVIVLQTLSHPPQANLFRRFLNLSLEARLVLWVARHHEAGDWLLLMTGERGDLFDLERETCLQQAETLQDWEEIMLPGLNALAGNRPNHLQPPPSHLSDARSLREWTDFWAMQLGASLEVAAEDAAQMLWKWILMLQRDRRVDPTESAGRWGLRCERFGDQWTIHYDGMSATEDLCRVLERFEEDFVTGLFNDPGDLHIGWIGRLEETSMIERIRAELLMHTQSRFEPETVAWLFTDLSREQEGWRREVSGVTPVRKRFHHAGWSVYRPMISDVGRYGLTAALHDVQHLAQYLKELDVFTRHRLEAKHMVRLSQPDLFCQNPRGVGPTGTLDDGANYLFGEAYRLRNVPTDQLFGSGVVFLLKALDLTAQLQWPFLGIDTLDCLHQAVPD